MNITNYEKLKFKYRFYSLLMVWLALALTIFPAWQFAHWLAALLNISTQGPVKEQENGLWLIIVFILFFTTCIMFFLFCISYVVAKYNGWSREQALDYFWRYENLPKHWMKDDNSNGG